MKREDVRRDRGNTDPVLLDEFEKKFNITFPGSYRKFIENYNAPCLEKNDFRFINKHHNELWSYRLEEDGTDSRDVTFYGFGEFLPEYEQIDRSQDFDVYGHDHIIAIGAAANGDRICLDYRNDPKTNEPHVVVMFHDAYGEDRKMLISHVANSFDEFLNSLYKSE